jgi:molybdenum cofactor biosynthesis enzyme MoaA
MADRSNFCALPFGHTAIKTNGDFSVCCIHQTPVEHRVNINNNGFKKWNQSLYLNEIRTAFKNNEQHPGCSVCWYKEKTTGTSLRTRIQQEYEILGVTDQTEFPVDIEVQVGNLCNLKCLMCNEQESSAILAENTQLGINQHQQKDFAWDESAFANLQELINTAPRVLRIRGGEPFYNKPLLNIIENLSPEACSRTMLQITTNCTQWSDRWAQALSKFRLVRLMFSVDAVEDLYEYIRYGANWSKTTDNIQQMVQQPNVKALLHCVVQNLNILEIGKLVKWAEKQNLYLQLEHLNEPSWMTITTLPEQLRKTAIAHIESVLATHPAEHIQLFLKVCLKTLEDSLINHPDTQLWEMFLGQIGQRDRIRGNDHRRFLRY